MKLKQYLQKIHDVDKRAFIYFLLTRKSEWLRVMIKIYNKPYLNISTLSRETGYGHKKIMNILRKLSELGYVVVKSFYRREKVIYLSQVGEEVLEKTLKIIEDLIMSTCRIEPKIYGFSRDLLSKYLKRKGFREEAVDYLINPLCVNKLLGEINKELPVVLELSALGLEKVEVKSGTTVEVFYVPSKLRETIA